MSVPVHRRVTGSANQINVTAVYLHTVCNCERASVLRHRGQNAVYMSRDIKRMLSPFLLSKRVFEHVFHAPHPRFRQKQDRTGLWTISSLGARRAILSSYLT